MKKHDYKLQAHELKNLIEDGQVEILNREDNTEMLRLELTEDVKTEKSESYTIEEKAK